MLRTDSAALTYKSTLPDSIVTGDDFLPGIPTLVSGVHVVPLTDGNGGWTYKSGIKGINGTGSLTEHAINTHRVLFVVSQLSRGLQIFTFLWGFFLTFLTNDVWLYFCQFCHKIIHLEDEIPLDWKTG